MLDRYTDLFFWLHLPCGVQCEKAANLYKLRIFLRTLQSFIYSPFHNSGQINEYKYYFGLWHFVELFKQGLRFVLFFVHVDLKEPSLSQR